MRRREFLKACSGLIVALAACGPAACARARGERCIHWYPLDRPLPRVLRVGRLDPADLQWAGADRGDFSAGLPELLVYSSAGPLRGGFPEFYPLTDAQLAALRSRITVVAAVARVGFGPELERAFARAGRAAMTAPGGAAAFGVVLTLHRKNLEVLPRILELAKGCGARELCVLKDPTLPPYLCVPQP